MEGTEAFRGTLLAVFGDRSFTAEDVMIEVERHRLPPGCQVYGRQRCLTASIAKHLASTPGVARVAKPIGRSRSRWSVTGG